jgi:membrane protein YqaA with SNARE-associated domain
VLRKLYDWTMRLAERPNALPALGVISFLESSFFPVPPDVMLIPMVLARRDRAWLIATVCTVASVFGAMLGYFIGAVLFETLGRWVIDLYGLAAKVAEFQDFYDRYGLAVILIKGLTPIPFKLVTITSGAMHFNIPLFIAACIVTRAGRFFLVAGLLKVYGESIRAFIEKRLTLLFFAFLILLIGGFAAIKYL